jgi:hypothetical protein
MKRFMYFAGMLCVTFVLGSALTGCVSPPPQVVSAGEAIDALGSSRITELQYQAGKTIVLTLMRTKNNQLDGDAVIKNGQPAYTRERVLISFGTNGMVVQRRTGEDGRLTLGVAFEEDESKLLWFVQTSTELAPFTNFRLVLDEASAEGAPIVKYGSAYYWVTSGSDAFLGITENFKRHTQSPKGRKIK